MSWPFLIIVTLIVWSGRVCSSRKVERLSVLVILVPLKAIVMSHSMIIDCSSIVTSCVPTLRLASSAAPPLMTYAISYP